MSKMFTKTLFLLPVLATLVSAFPNGAHNNGSNIMESLSSYCSAGNFRPNHGSYLPQASPSPFVINVMAPNGAMYSTGQPVRITIEGKPSAPGQPAKKIKGFFLQGDSTEAAFSGDIVCDQGQGKKVTFCSKIGVTHTNALPKDRIVCQWSPPDFQLGQVQFTATVLENFTHFWTGVKSEVTLFSDPKTMSYSQKAQQMRNQLMRQFQGTTQNMLNTLKQNGMGSAISNMFGANGAKGGNSNTMETLMNSFSKMGSNNQFASLFSGNGGGDQNNGFASLMGGNTGASNQGESNYWQSMTSGNQRSNSGYDLNNFRQFFQS